MTDTAGTPAGSGAGGITAETAARVARLAAAALGAPVALVGVGSREDVRLAASVAPPEGGPADAFCREAVGRVLASGAPVVVQDAGAERAEKDEPAVRAFVGVPVRGADGRVAGCIAGADHAPRAWTARDRAVLDDLASLLEAEVERAQAAASLRVNEARYRGVVEASPDLVFRVTRDGLHLDAHAGEHTQLAVPLDDVIGHTVRELLPEAVAALWLRALDAAVASGDGQEIAYPLVALDGRRHRYEARLVPLGGDEVQVVVRDVTRQHTTERALRASENRFRSFVEATTQIVWVADAEGRITALNDAWTTFAGGAEAADPATPGSWTDALHPNDRASVEALWDACVAGGDAFATECRVLRHDGASRWFAVRGVPVADADGAFAEWVGTCTDVTERREAAETVERSRRQYQRLVNGLGAIVWEGEVDKQTGDVAFTFISDQLRHLLGYEPAAWIADASRWAEAIVEEDRGRVLAERVGVRRSDDAEQPDDVIHEYRIRTADGRVVWLRDMINLIEDGEDRATVVGIAIDVTDGKGYEEALRTARREAEAAVQLKSSFLNNMSHEIRTPLTTIIGFADLLAEEAVGADRELVGMIQEGGRRLLITLNSVLDLARLESGGADLDLRTLDVAAEAAEVARLFERLTREKDLTLTFEAPVQAWARADAGALQRVLMNLLSNALKFTPSGGITVRVDVQPGVADEREVVVTVADTGVGMGAEFLETAFEPFRQESEGLARRHQGSGLGLTIVRQLMTLMRGRVEVASRQGEGTTFRLLFPYVERKDEGEPRAAASTTPRPRPLDAPDRSAVLVVEDDPNTRTLLRVILQDGFDVDAAASADEALARPGPYDVVLLDINLQGGASGIELLRALRAHPGYAGVPIIAVTAQALPGDDERMHREGFDAYLSKPFRRHDLVQLVRAALA